MNIRQLKSLIAQGESETLEFKTSTAQLKPACETLCGFLNAKGGIVLMGVNNKGQIIGQQITDSTHQEIANELRKIEPAAHISSGNTCLLLVFLNRINLNGLINLCYP